MSGERTVYDILTGQQRPVRDVVPPSAEPSPAERRVDLLEEAVTGTLAYLRMDPEARAKQEAGELLAAEQGEREKETTARIALENEFARIREEHQLTAGENLHAMETLRSLLGQAHDDNATQTASLDRERAITRRLQETLEAERVRYADELKKAHAVAPRTVVAPPASSPPSDINFEYQRHANGLLRNVLIRSEGYEDLIVDIERGADNRMHNIRLRR